MAQTIGIKDMRAFFAIVEEGNISHAAQRLGVAQPALSRQMKHLEENLHVKLFERGSRRIRLTEAGQVLYNRVESILGMVDGTVREITEIGSGTKGTVRIGTITSSGAMILPDLIAQFRKIYPDVTFEIWEAEGARILELLDSRIIEIAITRTQVDNLNYELLVLPNEPLVMVMNSQNVCGKGDTIRLAELEGELHRRLQETRLRPEHHLRIRQRRSRFAYGQDEPGHGDDPNVQPTTANRRRPRLQAHYRTGNDDAHRCCLAQESNAFDLVQELYRAV